MKSKCCKASLITHRGNPRDINVTRKSGKEKDFTTKDHFVKLNKMIEQALDENTGKAGKTQVNDRNLRTKISEILVKYNMPTKQVVISLIIDLLKMSEERR